MADVIQELLNAGSVDPEQLTKLLREQRDTGQIMALSGHSAVAPMGNGLREEANATAAGLGEAKAADGLARWKQAMEAMQKQAELEQRHLEGGLNRQNQREIAGMNNRGRLAAARLRKGGTDGPAGPPDFTGMAQNYRRLQGKAAQGITESSGWNTGIMSHLKGIGGTDAANFEQRLEPLRSEAALGALQQLKQASKTGASGLGSVTEREIDLLMSKLESLKTIQDEAQLDEALSEVEAHYASLADKMERAARGERFNETPNRSGGGTSPADPYADDAEFDSEQDDFDSAVDGG